MNDDNYYDGIEDITWEDEETSGPAIESRRTLLRLALGVAAIISVSEAAEWLPMGDQRARRWLRRSGLIRQCDGKEVVRWRDVLQALNNDIDGVATSPRTRAGKRSVAGVAIDEVEAWLEA